MANKSGLTYSEAITKACEIVKRDAEHFQADEFTHFPMDAQVVHLLRCLSCHPEVMFPELPEIEGNKAVLKEEAQFLIKFFYSKEENVGVFQRMEYARADFLINKYKLGVDSSLFNIGPIVFSFADEEFKFKQENPSICDPLPDFMKEYKHFKSEYKSVSIFGLLPTGKKYGGFVKAFLHWELQKDPEVLFSGEYAKHWHISSFRFIYNSTIFPNDKRIEWFANLGIKDEDCALWSRLFDQQYAGYKQVHKLFGQIS